MAMKLYWNKVCPFVQRAWITAIEKNVPIELVYIPLDVEAPDWYKAINPRETVPALQLADGRIILESMIVAKYFDEQFEPKYSLMTNEPSTRLRIDAFVNDIGPLIGYCYGLLFAENAQDESTMRDKANNAVAAVEARLQALSPGPFVLGNTFTMADIALVPFLDRFRNTLAAFRDFHIFAEAPRLKGLLDAAKLRPSVWSTCLSSTDYLRAYGGENRTVRTPLQWKLTAPKGSIAALSFRLTVNWLGADGSAFDVNVSDASLSTAIQLPSGETQSEAMSTVPLSILEYIGDTFGALAVADAFDRSRGRIGVDIATSLTSDDSAATAASQLEALISGPYLLGKAPTIYDAAVLPLVAAAAKKPSTAAALGPKLQALLQAAKATASVKDILE